MTTEVLDLPDLPANLASQARTLVAVPTSTGSLKFKAALGAATAIATGSGFVFRGAWAPGTQYAVDDVLTSGGQTYVVTEVFVSDAVFAPVHMSIWAAKGEAGQIGRGGGQGPAGAAGNPGGPGTPGQGFTLRGAWTPATAYSAFDVLTNAGQTYVVGSPFTSGTIFDAMHLTLWAAKGDVGLTGSGGAAGVGFTAAAINGGGHLVLTKSDGTTVDLGNVQGAAGAAGAVGAAGTSFTAAAINGAGHLVLTKSDGTTVDLGNVQGAAGAAGAAGAGFTGAVINSAGHLVLTKSDGTTIDLGNVQGAAGAAGAPGAAGAGYTAAAINGADHLMLTKSDGTTVDLGNVQGTAGAAGGAGAPGAAGVGYTAAAINGAGLVLTKSDGTTVDLGNIQGAAGAQGPVGPPGSGVGYNPRGAWQANTDYAVGDVVSELGSSYVTLTAFRSGSSFASPNWALQALAGTAGSAGAAGAAGAGYTAAAINGAGHLVLTKSDGTTADLGNVQGAAGAAGAAGAGYTGAVGPCSVGHQLDHRRAAAPGGNAERKFFVLSVRRLSPVARKLSRNR